MKKLLVLGVLAVLTSAILQTNAYNDTTKSLAAPVGITNPVALTFDYLKLSAGASAPNPATTIRVSWDGNSQATYKVQWRESSGGNWGNELEVDIYTKGLTTGSGRWNILIPNLSCNTKYDLRVKLVGWVWSKVSATTSACGANNPCPVAAESLALNSSSDHLFFIGTDKRVHNFWWDGSMWQLDWLGPAQIATGNLVLNSSADHVFFIGTDNRVYNYWQNGGWQLDWY